MFTTASSPVIPSAILKSLELIKNGEDRRNHLQALIARLRDGLKGTRWKLLPSFTAIQPVVVGENDRVLKVSEALSNRGIWVPAIRPPTVPKGSARLRISLSAAHTEDQVAQLVDALREIK